MPAESRPVIWSIAGSDSGGAAGLSADQRAADAFGVHLCPVVAAVTAQNSRAVARVEPVRPELLGAQLAALEDDLPPHAVKTGLLGSAALIEVVARWIDRLRSRRPVALVVDPVFAASTGASFADENARRAYRELLLPRADLVTPNRREAEALAGTALAAPALAAELRSLGAGAVCVTGGDDAGEGALALDWVDTDHARGWLALPRIDTAHTHGTGCTFATSAAAALALDFAAADALVLAKMATAGALQRGYRAGQGAGPVRASTGFAGDPRLLPSMSFDAVPPQPPAARTVVSGQAQLYAIVDRAALVRAVVAAGVKIVQLRIKQAEQAQLREQIRASVEECRAGGARLFVNDYWQLAKEAGADGVHLGQEDLAALGPDGRRSLADSGLALGVSSHCLWELARATALAPEYIACGPVWPTATKAMPWREQGLGNLAWWCAIAPRPVAAIGGILTAEQARAAASCGARYVCMLRAIAEHPHAAVPPVLDALRAVSADLPIAVPELPSTSILSKTRSA
ncbi:MAG: bifunctional hydroxymethylpyrimidine kinase/phosphomethylpyrimidine kinase [Burkholderiaceae bacterium]|nr:bifunctional hydroxymethylpyrimidine kinase/phosphomethylpyrimidine kinase [Burkholderiaceae bacterium]